MENRSVDRIDTIAAYHNWVRQLTDSEKGTWVFRGQRNTTWYLECGATRRLKLSSCWTQRNSVHEEIFDQYHRVKLLGPARTHGFAMDEGRELGDLELLAKLQLLGAATLLLDFTRDSFVALWFACQGQEDGDRSDARVFAINIADKSRFRELSASQARGRNNLSTVLGNSDDEDRSLMSWYWTPPMAKDTAPRILRQHSLFVFGQVEFPKVVAASAVIPAERKTDFLKILDQQHDLSKESLFKDVYGFAVANNHESQPPTVTTFAEHVLDGAENFNQKNFEDAIQNFSEAAHIRPSSADAHFLLAHARSAQGLAKRETRQFKEAIEDYTMALNSLEQKITESAMAYGASQDSSVYENAARILIGKANCQMRSGQLDRAVQGFSQCIDIGKYPSLVSAAILNRANTLFKMGRWDCASKDYQEVIARDVDLEGSNILRNAHFNLGNIYILQKNYQCAQAQYEKAIEIDPECTNAKQNKSAVLALSGDLRGALQMIAEHGLQTPNKEIIERALSGTQDPSFIGFIGNFGNTGSFAPVVPFLLEKQMVLKGGKGFPGDRAFAIKPYNNQKDRRP